MRRGDVGYLGAMPKKQAALAEAMAIDGALGVAIVDSASGRALATAGEPAGIDLAVAAAGNSAVVRAKQATIAELGLDEALEDMLMTLHTQYHLIRVLDREPTLFVYLVLDRNEANLSVARFRLNAIAARLPG